LLLDKGVPFEPEELLRDGWATKLKDVLNGMPEMHQVRYETAPLNGAYIADTLYLPETVQLTGHTVILTNNLVFEGKRPVIRGPYDLNIFPALPVGVLGTTLSEALGNKAGFLNVTWRGQHTLPSFSLLREVAQTEGALITFDTSGAKPQARRRAIKTAKLARMSPLTLYKPPP
jgi:hypothetical protein